jgi:hypothetical protein
MKLMLLLLIPVLLLSGCANLPFFKSTNVVMGPTEAIGQRPQSRPISQTAMAPPKGARTAATLDTTTAEQKAAALAAPVKPAGEHSLGETVVALGNVMEPGFWLRAALVKTAGPGRVVTAGGASIAVKLIPGEGAAQLSLAAFRALNLPLTNLPKVTIFAQ